VVFGEYLRRPFQKHRLDTIPPNQTLILPTPMLLLLYEVVVVPDGSDPRYPLIAPRISSLPPSLTGTNAAPGSVQIARNGQHPLRGTKLICPVIPPFRGPVRCTATSTVAPPSCSPFPSVVVAPPAATFLAPMAVIVIIASTGAGLYRDIRGGRSNRRNSCGSPFFEDEGLPHS